MAKILIVDDAPVDRTIAGGLVASVAGWEVQYAAHGREALDRLALEVPDLILTDLHMPQLDGLGLVDAVKSSYPRIPVILMTHHGDEHLALQAMERGAASYVPKRAMGRLLRATVQRVLLLAREGQTHDEVMRHVTRREEFVLRSDPNYVDFLANYFRKSLSEVWPGEHTQCVRVGVAVAEALSNAIYHGNLELGSELRVADSERFYRLAVERGSIEPYASRRLKVIAEVSPREARYCITDQGRGFNPGSLPDPTATDWLDHPGGRGVLLMRSFMDEVHFDATGNEVTLVKRRAVVHGATPATPTATDGYTS